MKRFLGIVILVALLVIFFCGCGKQGEEEAAHRSSAAKPWQSVDTCMGTVVQQTIYATDQDTAIAFSGQVMELLTHLEKEEISWRLDTSQIYQANASAGGTEGFVLSEDMADLLEACLELYEQSEGALDVTLGTVTGLWNMDKWAAEEDKNGFSLPAKEDLEKALSLCGGEKVKLEQNAAGNRVLFLPQGMRLDLGAVGKGYAMEKLSALLAEEPHVTGAVISLGGSILTYGDKPDGGPWRVGIIDPFDTSDSIGILTLEGQWCISTSGDYERYVEIDGVRYHHILDPGTGAPAVSDVRGVTVLLKDGLLSDGLSTACYILGPEKGIALAEQYGAETMFVMSDGRIEMSDGMKEYFSERRAE